MEERKHYFDTLGLNPGAPSEDIVNAYKELMEYWNPERVPDYYKQKAMEGRDKIKEAYEVLMGLRKDQKEVHTLPQKPLEKMKPEKPVADIERTLLGKDRDGSQIYLNKKSIVFNKDKVEIAIDIYPPEGSTQLQIAQGYVRRAGYEGLECLSERWGLGLSNSVFIKYGIYYKSTCGKLIQASGDTRKVWKPITPGTLEEAAWKVVDGMMQKEKVA
jgi:hypothetical protein